MKIVNRIVTSLLALATFPFLISQLFFRIVLSINEESLAYSLINMFSKGDNMLTGNRLGLQESLWDIFQMVIGEKENTFNFDFMSIWNSLPEDLASSKNLIIASLVFVVLGVLIAIVIIGCAIFTKAYKTIIGLGLGGFVSFLLGIILFGKAGEPLVSGDVDALKLIADLLTSGEGGGLGSIVTGLLQGTVSVDSFALGGAVFGAMIMMLAVAIWELAFYVTLPEKDKPKKLKKKKA